MSSKAFHLLLCISLAVFLMIGSEVTARELAETTSEASLGTDSYGHWGHKGGHKSGDWGGHKGGHKNGHWGGHGGSHGGSGHKPGPGGSCGNAGCCGGATSHGVCKRCCAYKGEIAAEP